MDELDDVFIDAAFAQIERLARVIDPSLPTDLSGYELRITMNENAKSVETVRCDFADAA